ncbi:hypothetical protein SAMN04488505_1011440 [Chitinophaga rupis]|uniref:Quinol monooxygenase YgiN n=1 Tax=Chitinophaga rupis TaxID=573321 RepID=A0A1H7M9P0_9BACT|nr:hypothetical protein [Chitinophaga rupis]SEL07799.1 hypothetical protein SAMN04488505_1011440 [Chitinophaga rupis]
MKIVKVTYTVNADFSDKNQQNVKEFVKDIEALNNPAIRYISYLGSDGKTFTHIATFDNDEAQKEFLELPSFKSFQQQRNGSGLEAPENLEMITIVAASYKIFG